MSIYVDLAALGPCKTCRGSKIQANHCSQQTTGFGWTAFHRTWKEPDPRGGREN